MGQVKWFDFEHDSTKTPPSDITNILTYGCHTIELSDGTLLKGIDREIYRSTNDGVSFSGVKTFTNGHIVKFWEDSWTLGKCYVAEKDGNIWYSTDYGATWTAYESGTTRGWWDVFQCLDSDHKDLLACYDGGAGTSYWVKWNGSAWASIYSGDAPGDGWCAGFQCDGDPYAGSLGSMYINFVSYNTSAGIGILWVGWYSVESNFALFVTFMGENNADYPSLGTTYKFDPYLNQGIKVYDDQLDQLDLYFSCIKKSNSMHCLFYYDYQLDGYTNISEETETNSRYILPLNQDYSEGDFHFLATVKYSGTAWESKVYCFLENWSRQLSYIHKYSGFIYAIFSEPFYLATDTHTSPAYYRHYAYVDNGSDMKSVEFNYINGEVTTGKIKTERVFEYNQTLLFYEDDDFYANEDNLLFRGLIIKKVYEGNMYIYHLRSFDKEVITLKITESYDTKTAKEIIEDIVVTKTSFLYVNDSLSAFSNTYSFDFYNAPFDTILNTLMDEEDGIWWIDPDGLLHAYKIADIPLIPQLGTEDGIFPSTYDFKDVPVGTKGTDIDFVDSATTNNNCYAKIIESIDEHKKVLEIYHDGGASDPQVYNTISQVSGIIEWWWGCSDVGQTQEVSFGSAQNIILKMSNTYWWYDTAWRNTGVSASNNILDHHKIVFNCEIDAFDWYINGVLVACGEDFYAVGTSINRLQFTPQSNNAYSMYIDSIGYSWEGYVSGDNTWWQHYQEGEDSFEDEETSEEGDYYGTYSFEGEVGDTDLDISWVDVWGQTDTGGVAIIIASEDGHKTVMKVISNGDNGMYAYWSHNNISLPTPTPTLEFWAKYIDKGVGLMNFYYDSDDTDNLASSYFLSTDNKFYVTHGDGLGGSTTSVGVAAAADTWHRVKLEFDFNADTFTVYLNGVAVVTDVTFRNDINGINLSDYRVLLQGGAGANSLEGYVDAIGHSWDDNYLVNDNINPYGRPSDLAEFIDIYDIDNGCEISIIPNFDDHKKVLKLLAVGVTSARNVFSSVQTDSTIEFYMAVSDIGAKIFYIHFYEGASARVTLKFVNGDMFERSGGVYNLVKADYMTADVFDHIKVIFNDTANTCDIYINGVLEGNDKPYYTTSTVGIDRFICVAASATTSLYIDAVGYSWSTNYFIGRNKSLAFSIYKTATMSSHLFKSVPKVTIYSMPYNKIHLYGGIVDGARLENDPLTSGNDFESQRMNGILELVDHYPHVVDQTQLNTLADAILDRTGLAETPKYIEIHLALKFIKAGRILNYIFSAFADVDIAEDYNLLRYNYFPLEERCELIFSSGLIQEGREYNVELHKTVHADEEQIDILAAEVKEHFAIGCIIEFHGSFTNNVTMKGWYICDGSNGTIDLRQKFIRGASTSGGSGGSDDAIAVSHRHLIMGEQTAGSGGLVARVLPYTSPVNSCWSQYAGSSGVGANKPAYKELIFIQRIS